MPISFLVLSTVSTTLTAFLAAARAGGAPPTLASAMVPKAPATLPSVYREELSQQQN
jgi:hypothetical protein